MHLSLYVFEIQLKKKIHHQIAQVNASSIFEHHDMSRDCSRSLGDLAIDHVLSTRMILHRIGMTECDPKLRQSFTVMSLFFQLLQRHASADRMVVLLSIYEEEDEAYQTLVTVATTFFQYLLQPFRDMRELACLYKMEILVNAKLCLHVWSTNRNRQIIDK